MDSTRARSPYWSRYSSHILTRFFGQIMRVWVPQIVLKDTSYRGGDQGFAQSNYISNQHAVAAVQVDEPQF